MPLFESSQLLVSYLMCQTALKEFQTVRKTDKRVEVYVNDYCLPLLHTPTGTYILEQLVEVAFSHPDPKLVRELLKLAQKRKEKLPKSLYYEILALNSFANKQLREFIDYGIKAVEYGCKSIRLLFYLDVASEVLKDTKAFYVVVNRLHQLNKPIKPFLDSFFYNQIFPINEETLKVARKLLELESEEGYVVSYSLMLESLGKFQEEEQVLKEALKKFPNSDAVKKALIRFYIKQGKQKDALKFVSSKELEKFYYFQLLETVEDFPKFREIANEVLKRYPNDYLLLLRVLTGYIVHDYLEGLNSLEKLFLSKKEMDEDKADLLATVLTAKFTLTGKWEPDEKVLINELYSKYPYEEKLKLLKALLDISEGNLKEAKELLKEINPENTTAYAATISNALRTYLGLKTPQETFPKENLFLADTYLKTIYWLDKNFYLKVVKTLQQETRNGEECLAYTSPAWLFGDLKLSLELSKVCLQKFGNNSNVLNSVGYIMLLVDPERFLNEAKNLIRKAIEINPQNVDAYDSLGWAYYHEGNLKEALKWVAKTLEKVPNSVVANYHMAQILYKLNKPCEALKYLNRTLKEKENLSREPEPGIYQKMENLKRELINRCRR